MELNKKILSEIEKELSPVFEQIVQKKVNGEVSAIEQEWLKSRLTAAFDLVLKLNKGETIIEKPVESKIAIEQLAKTEGKEASKIKIEKTVPVSPKEPKKTEEVQFAGEDLKAFVRKDMPIPQEEIAKSSMNVDPVNLIEKADLKILAEKFKSSGKSLYEAMGEQVQPQKDLHEKIQATTVKSITQGIGINDKFLFVKELFKGDSEAFHKTINNLDKAESFDEIYNYLKTNFDWDTESEHVQRLLGIAKRKFAHDK